jgi:hypothetical protein
MTSIELIEESSADVLFDKIEITFVSTRPFQAPIDEFVRNLINFRVVAPVRQLGGAPTRQLDVRFSVKVAHDGVVSFSGRLALGADGTGARLLPSSYISLNLMRVLRTQVENPPPEEFAGDNFIGPYGDHWPDLLSLQLAAADKGLGALLEAVHKAGGGDPSESILRLRCCEVCRDRRVPDAPTLARRMEADFVGGVARRARGYANPSAELRGNFVTVSWDDGVAEGPVARKIYAKGQELLRTEVAARTVKAVARLIVGRRAQSRCADFSAQGGGVQTILAKVAAAARPLLDELWLDSEAVEAPGTGGLDLLLSFAPLLRLAAPLTNPASAGRRIAPETQIRARSALSILLQFRRFDARGVPASDSVRKALDEMTLGDAPALERQGPRGTLFVVPPGHTAAVKAFAEALGLS